MHAEVLRRNPRAVVAMRRAFCERRFGLILGAGVSRAFDFEVPAWRELLAKLASHPKIAAAKIDSDNGAPTTRADLLFRYFKKRLHKELTPISPIEDYVVDRIARGEWRALIREILYENAPPPHSLKEHHPYLGTYLDIVLESPLTITYNFDSYLELMLADRKSTGGHGRGYEVVFDGSKPFRSTTGVIYHPNGYLPLNVLDHPSDDLVFSEEQFGNQLLASMEGHYSSLAHHLSKQTCLFIGLSLSDENLRHLLRRNAVSNPGHFHYYVDWVDPHNPTPAERSDALFDYRFSVYNMVSLFLSNDEISALGDLIQMPFDEFRSVADAADVPTKFVYYLTGIPGIGKTTLLRHLASLSVYDEWPSEPLSLLAKPHSELTPEEQAQLDDWVAKQMREKNERLMAENEGLFVVERGPLDPISFAAKDEIIDKAKSYRARVTPTSYDCLGAGEVLLLWGDSEKVSTRIASRQTITQSPQYLDQLQERLTSIVYTGNGVRLLHSTEWSITELVRAVVAVIHLEDYQPADLQSRIAMLAAGKPTT